MTDYLSIDWETYSETDLKKAGLGRYVRDPSTEVLMGGWAFNADPVKLWVPARGQKMPSDLRDGMRDPKVIKRAWNAQFERAVSKFVLGIDVPVQQWRCVMALAYTLALPGSLANAGEVVGLPADKKKDSRGKALIRRFCMPRKPTKVKPWTRETHETAPKEWEEFEGYCMQDVESERAMWRRIRQWDMPAHEWELWFLDQEINEAGVPINMQRVRNAIEIRDYVVEKRLTALKKLTGLDNPNSNSQLLGWIEDRGVYPFTDLKKGHVSRALERPEVKEDKTLVKVLCMRQEISKTSVKKYNALASATDDDGFLRYTLQFAGAGRTWRWAGRKFQVQNLVRPVSYLEKRQVEVARDIERLDPESIELLYDKPMDVLSTGIRPAIEAPDKHVLASADLNAIENRVLGWMCDEPAILEVFEKNLDPYIAFSVHMVGGTYEERWAEYKAGNKKTRTLSKPPVLGCGYRLSAGKEFENDTTGEIEATGLLGYGLGMGVKMTLAEAEHAVTVWREAHPNVCEYWNEIEWAAKRCIRTEQRQTAKWVTFDRSGPFMRMQLPSGRHLHYCRPRIENLETPWGKMRATITYEQLDDKNRWTRTKTQGGKLVENGDQAISRDILAHSMRLARSRGLFIRLHVHDEIVSCVRQENGERALKILLDCMGTPPTWAPGLPLAAAGSVSRVYVKD